MKSLAIVFLTTQVAFGATSSTKPMTQTYKVDAAPTKITYVGKKVTGEHTGNLNVKAGTLIFQGEQITGGEVVVDMNTLTSTDITDKEMNTKYVGHMKSPDFFNTEKFPESKLVIKNSKKTAKGLEVTADLTLVGETKPVTFVINDLKMTDTSVSGKTNLVLNRTQWGLKYGSGSFFKGLGDKAINDEFTLAIDLTAKK